MLLLHYKMLLLHVSNHNRDKTWLVPTQAWKDFDFSWLCKLELQEENALRQIQSFFCLREFVGSSDLRSAPQTAKKPFLLKSQLTRSLEETPFWYWVASDTQ